jgi:hypothetical protein
MALGGPAAKVEEASRIGGANPTSSLWRPGGRRPGHTLATALYVTTDDLLRDAPYLAPWRPAVGIRPKLIDAELVTLAVLQALLGFCSEARWLRYARAHLGDLFPYLPKQPGSNKRLRAAADLIGRVIGVLASDTTFWTDDVWVADSTPVECGRSRETTKRSELADWAAYGYCASHSRWFWGLRLHLVCTLPGPAGRLCAGRRQSRRAPGAGGHPGRRPDPGGHPARPDPHRRQARLRPPVRGGAGRSQRSRPVPSGQPRTTPRPLDQRGSLPSQVTIPLDLALGAGGRPRLASALAAPGRPIRSLVA